MLQGELDVVLDLINLMEGQHFLGVANVAVLSDAHHEEQQQALRLQQKVSQLRVCLTSALEDSVPLGVTLGSFNISSLSLGTHTNEYVFPRLAASGAQPCCCVLILVKLCSVFCLDLIK